MKMTEDKGLSKIFKGEHGEAIITRNFGNMDKKDHYSVAVMINGKYKKLATRTTYEKALAMAEKAIG